LHHFILSFILIERSDEPTREACTAISYLAQGFYLEGVGFDAGRIRLRALSFRSYVGKQSEISAFGSPTDHSAQAPSNSRPETLSNGTGAGTLESRGAAMKDMMKHKGYWGSVHFNDEDDVFYGRIEFIRALVSYEGTDVRSLRQAFQEAVDEYLKTCEEQHRQPEKPFKGSFNIRISPQLHQRIAARAANKGMSINGYIAEILEKHAGDAA
jgi:predicted HicB family RNase H-like nuclease